MNGHEDEDVGYKKPPASKRFRKGESGNPRGRPKGRRNMPPYETVLGKMITIREGGIERRVTTAEAFLMHITKQGLAGDSAAARATMNAIDAARKQRFGTHLPKTMVIHWLATVGETTDSLEALRMGRTLDPYRECARFVLEPWLVQAALARLGERRLSIEEQETVIKSTRTPWKVDWPGWWKANARK